MPSKSEKQRRFMWLVHGLQKGKLSPKKVGGKVAKAAHSMSSSDVNDFLMECMGLKECNLNAKSRLLKVLKELQEPMNLEEDDMDTSSQNVISSIKTFHGDFEKTIKMYRGYELSAQENQAIQNFDRVKPVEHNKFLVKYSKSDDFGNTTTIIIKKLQDKSSGKFVYTALIKNRSGNDDLESSEESPTNQNKEGDDIKIIKSIPINDYEGSEILTNFLEMVYFKKA